MKRREFHRLVVGLIGCAITGRSGQAEPAASPLRVNGGRLNQHLSTLAGFGKNPQGGVSRVAYSEADREARRYVAGLMRAAGLEVEIDRAANLRGFRPGSEAGLAPLMLGSHIDTVPEGGNYDGTVGSIGAIEVVETLSENGLQTRHPLEVLIFQNEEGGKTGSRAVSGELIEKELALVTQSGKTIGEGISFLGGDPLRLESARRPPGSIAAYLELHVEQGGILDEGKIPIGVVEGIVGIKRWNVTIEGFANHAGTTPMNRRQDALLAAARFIDSVHRVVTSLPGRQVGTVGRIQAFPGAANVIPGRVATSLEIRDLDMSRVDAVFEKIQSESASLAPDTGTRFSFEEIYLSHAAPTDERLRGLIEASAGELGLRSLRLPSGAGHDAQSIALLAPVGMIFVPSVGGISHSPREHSRPEDIVAGANVLLQTLVKLDARGLG
jgi:N-carbamoyl-L-amino-acid hydrolase